ncbi:MAG: hypothetical protein R6X02_32515 [Enhygromyxa sp.]
MLGRSQWLLWCLLWTLLGCAGRNAGPPRYKPVEELQRCQPDECVQTYLKFRRWAHAEHFKGRMPYHCDPGSELDGRPDPKVTRMIFVVHGVYGPDADLLARLDEPPGLYQLRNVLYALRRAQKLDPSVDPERYAIIAPTFQRTDEWQPYTDDDPRVWSWTRASYPLGTVAEYREAMSGIVKAESVSSFDVLDEFLRAAVVKFPNLEDIVITGHSAGGQFVHRYVWMGVGVHEQLAAAGIRVRYMPANGGSYAFPLPQRKTPPGRGSVPPGPGRGDIQSWRWINPQGCKGWDDWGYGLGNLSKAKSDRPVRAANYAIDHYLRPHDRALARKALRNPGSAIWNRAARQALILMYASREVWHIQAATDHENTFPENCRSQLEGRSRYERFINFQELWTRKLGVAAPDLHFVALEASHPHSSKVVYSSDAGIHLLFH